MNLICLKIWKYILYFMLACCYFWSMTWWNSKYLNHCLWLLKVKKTCILLIWVLDIWMNSQLWWNKHVKKMLNKMKIQINMLVCITAFIWKVMLATVHHIYNAVIRSVLTHIVAIWHMSLNTNELKMTHQNYKNELIKKLVKMQNKYL